MQGKRTSPAARRLLSVLSPEGGSLSQGLTVSVAQFNILASNLGLPNHFPYVKPHVLDWTTRHATLLKEMEELKVPSTQEGGFDPVDIIALVELSNYWELFKDRLGERGYNSVFLKRPSITATSWSGVNKFDGCGIFFQRTKFELVKEFSVNYKDEHDRVGLLVLLKSKQNGQLVLVVSTHLYWDSEKVETQLKELKELEEAILTMRQEVEAEYGEKDVPVIWTGDFNNGPQSPIYQHVTQAIGTKEGESPLFRSAYDVYGHLDEAQGSIAPKAGGPQSEAPFTSVNYKRKWTIDYVFYTQSRLKVTHLLEIPKVEGLQEEDGPEGWVAKENEKLRKAFEEKKKANPSLSETALRLIDEQKNNNGIPNSVFGSDHLPILAVFQLV